MLRVIPGISGGLPRISTDSLEHGSGYAYKAAAGTLGSATADTPWPTANHAVYVAVTVEDLILVDALGIPNGSVVSGNFDIGIYKHNKARIVSTGSTAQAGAFALQKTTITATLLVPGVYYFAIVFDNTTGRTFQHTLSAGWAMLSSSGLRGEASAFPLPTTATFSPQSTINFPVIWAYRTGF